MAHRKEFKFTILTPWVLLPDFLPDHVCIDEAADKFCEILCLRSNFVNSSHAYWPTGRGEAHLFSAFDIFEEKFLKNSEYAVIVLSGSRAWCMDQIFSRLQVFLTMRPSWTRRILLVFLGEPEGLLSSDILSLANPPFIFRGSSEDDWCLEEKNWMCLLDLLSRNYTVYNEEATTFRQPNNNSWLSVTDLRGKPLAIRITQSADAYAGRRYGSSQALSNTWFQPSEQTNPNQRPMSGISLAQPENHYKYETCRNTSPLCRRDLRRRSSVERSISLSPILTRDELYERLVSDSRSGLNHSPRTNPNFSPKSNQTARWRPEYLYRDQPNRGRKPEWDEMCLHDSSIICCTSRQGIRDSKKHSHSKSSKRSQLPGTAEDLGGEKKRKHQPFRRIREKASSLLAINSPVDKFGRRSKESLGHAVRALANVSTEILSQPERLSPNECRPGMFGMDVDVMAAGSFRSHLNGNDQNVIPRIGRSRSSNFPPECQTHLSTVHLDSGVGSVSPGLSVCSGECGQRSPSFTHYRSSRYHKPGQDILGPFTPPRLHGSRQCATSMMDRRSVHKPRYNYVDSPEDLNGQNDNPNVTYKMSKLTEERLSSPTNIPGNPRRRTDVPSVDIFEIYESHIYECTTSEQVQTARTEQISRDSFNTEADLREEYDSPTRSTFTERENTESMRENTTSELSPIYYRSGYIEHYKEKNATHKALKRKHRNRAISDPISPELEVILDMSEKRDKHVELENSMDMFARNSHALSSFQKTAFDELTDSSCNEVSSSLHRPVSGAEEHISNHVFFLKPKPTEFSVPNEGTKVTSNWGGEDMNRTGSQAFGNVGDFARVDEVECVSSRQSDLADETKPKPIFSVEGILDDVAEVPVLKSYKFEEDTDHPLSVDSTEQLCEPYGIMELEGAEKKTAVPTEDSTASTIGENKLQPNSHSVANVGHDGLSVTETSEKYNSLEIGFSGEDESERVVGPESTPSNAKISSKQSTEQQEIPGLCLPCADQVPSDLMDIGFHDDLQSSEIHPESMFTNVRATESTCEKLEFKNISLNEAEHFLQGVMNADLPEMLKRAESTESVDECEWSNSRAESCAQENVEVIDQVETSAVFSFHAAKEDGQMVEAGPVNLDQQRVNDIGLSEDKQSLGLYESNADTCCPEDLTLVGPNTNELSANKDTFEEAGAGVPPQLTQEIHDQCGNEQIRPSTENTHRVTLSIPKDEEAFCSSDTLESTGLTLFEPVEQSEELSVARLPSIFGQSIHCQSSVDVKRDPEEQDLPDISESLIDSVVNMYPLSSHPEDAADMPETKLKMEDTYGSSCINPDQQELESELTVTQGEPDWEPVKDTEESESAQIREHQVVEMESVYKSSDTVPILSGGSRDDDSHNSTDSVLTTLKGTLDGDSHRSDRELEIPMSNMVQSDIHDPVSHDCHIDESHRMVGDTTLSIMTESCPDESNEVIIEEKRDEMLQPIQTYGKLYAMNEPNESEIMTGMSAEVGDCCVSNLVSETTDLTTKPASEKEPVLDAISVDSTLGDSCQIHPVEISKSHDLYRQSSLSQICEGSMDSRTCTMDENGAELALTQTHVYSGRETFSDHSESSNGDFRSKGNGEKLTERTACSLESVNAAGDLNGIQHNDESRREALSDRSGHHYGDSDSKTVDSAKVAWSPREVHYNENDHSVPLNEDAETHSDNFAHSVTSNRQFLNPMENTTDAQHGSSTEFSTVNSPAGELDYPRSQLEVENQSVVKLRKVQDESSREDLVLKHRELICQNVDFKDGNNTDLQENDTSVINFGDWMQWDGQPFFDVIQKSRQSIANEQNNHDQSLEIGVHSQELIAESNNTSFCQSQMPVTDSALGESILSQCSNKSFVTIVNTEFDTDEVEPRSTETRTPQTDWTDSISQSTFDVTEDNSGVFDLPNVTEGLMCSAEQLSDEALILQENNPLYMKPCTTVITQLTEPASGHAEESKKHDQLSTEQGPDSSETLYPNDPFRVSLSGLQPPLSSEEYIEPLANNSVPLGMTPATSFQFMVSEPVTERVTEEQQSTQHSIDTAQRQSWMEWCHRGFAWLVDKQDSQLADMSSSGVTDQHMIISENVANLMSSSQSGMHVDEIQDLNPQHEFSNTTNKSEIANSEAEQTNEPVELRDREPDASSSTAATGDLARAQSMCLTNASEPDTQIRGIQRSGSLLCNLSGVLSFLHFISGYMPRHAYWFYLANFESREQMMRVLSTHEFRIAITWNRIQDGLRNPAYVAAIFICISTASPHLSQWPMLFSYFVRAADLHLFTPPFWVDRPILSYLGRFLEWTREQARTYGNQAVITRFSTLPWALVNPAD